jgi:hypothetical protein
MNNEQLSLPEEKKDQLKTKDIATDKKVLIQKAYDKKNIKDSQLTIGSFIYLDLSGGLLGI